MARQAYERWIADMMGRHDEWTAYLVTFMFNDLPGSTGSRPRQMAKEIEHFYTTLITRVTRRPNRGVNVERCPRLFALPDLPRRGSRSSSDDVAVNDGLHFHGVLLLPTGSRLKCGLGEHVAANRGLYLGSHGRLRDIHIVEITSDPERVAGYVFKLWKWNPEFGDHHVVLPRSRSELDGRANAAGGGPCDSTNMK
jgi:hypothetical protein